MAKYLNIYLHILKLSFMRDLTYRTGFYSGLVAAASQGVAQAAAILLIGSLNDGVAGWTQADLILFIGVQQLFVYLLFFLFYRSMAWFHHDIFSGNFDYILTKPLDPQFMVSIRPGGLHNLVSALAGFFLITWAVIHFGLRPNAVQVLIAVFLLACGLLLSYSLLLMASLLAFKFERVENIIDLVIDWTTGVSRFPLQAYQNVARVVFLFLLPLALITTTPAQILLNRLNLSTALQLILISLGVGGVARRLFYLAIRSYTSASS